MYRLLFVVGLLKHFAREGLGDGLELLFVFELGRVDALFIHLWQIQTALAFVEDQFLVEIVHKCIATQLIIALRLVLHNYLYRGLNLPLLIKADSVKRLIYFFFKLCTYFRLVLPRKRRVRQFKYRALRVYFLIVKSVGKTLNLGLENRLEIVLFLIL